MAIRRIALIGSRGHWSATVREVAKIPSLQIVALADGGDTCAPVAEWCRENGHRPTIDGDHLAMLDRGGIDMAVVCGPFEAHAAMCVDAIDRGVHVLTEKPAALTSEQLDHLRAATSREPGVHLAEMMFSRYAPGFFTAHELIRAGAIGEVRLIDARKSYKLGERAEFYRDRKTYGGTIPWVGSHAIDWVMWFCGKPLESVMATQSTAHNNGLGTMERSAACQFTFAGGCAAQVSIDVFRPASALTHGDDWARIVGSEGIIEARADSLTLINATSDGSSSHPVACDRFLMRDFVDHVDGKREALIDAQSTLALNEACLLARDSADEGVIKRFQTRDASAATRPH